MLDAEKREYPRVLFYRGAIVEHGSDDMGESVMHDIVIKDISLGGVGFAVTDPACSYERHGVYNLRLKADLPWKNVELYLKIAIIRAAQSDGSGGFLYGAVYRNLSDAQLAGLKEIIDYQAGLDALINGSLRKATA